jgi:hypothetical protein
VDGFKEAFSLFINHSTIFILAIEYFPHAKTAFDNRMHFPTEEDLLTITSDYHISQKLLWCDFEE